MPSDQQEKPAGEGEGGGQGGAANAEADDLMLFADVLLSITKDPRITVRLSALKKCFERRITRR